MRKFSKLNLMSVLLLCGLLFAFSALVIQNYLSPTLKTKLRLISKPNIIVIMTDDQRLDDMDVMPLTQNLIGAKGTIFNNYFVSNPLCCPSRAAFLTGQYSHNNGVWGNEDNIFTTGGYKALKKGDTLPVWLNFNGYSTIHVGKYLNGYGYFNKSEIPPGWTQWFGLVGKQIHRYYDFTINENGNPIDYQRDENLHNKNYNTDVITDKAIQIITNTPGPFFLSIAYIAPHGQIEEGSNNDASLAIPADRHKHKLISKKLPIPPNFNESNLNDKSAYSQYISQNLITDSQIANIGARYQARQESLIAVDEGVEKIIAALEKTHKIDSTYVFFTSDNGFMQGEHRIAYGKGKFYDEVIRVPLMVRGPGIPIQTRNELVVNIDLAPTIADLTNSLKYVRLVMDGQSIKSILLNNSVKKWRNDFLIEGDNKIFQGVRTINKEYIQFNVPYKHGSEVKTATFFEQYDLSNDPYQLNNQLSTSISDTYLVNRLNLLKTCSGISCH